MLNVKDTYWLFDDYVCALEQLGGELKLYCATEIPCPCKEPDRLVEFKLD